MITPDGILSLPLARLAAMIAASPAFVTWCNGATDRIHLLATSREPLLPLCLLDLGDSFNRERVVLTPGRPFAQSGQLVAYFRDAVDQAHSDQDAAYSFCNHLGAVWADLEAMAGKPGFLSITSMTLLASPERIEAERRPHLGDLYEAVLGITWRATA
jgi:hypothetical protein